MYADVREEYKLTGEFKGLRLDLQVEETELAKFLDLLQRRPLTNHWGTLRGGPVRRATCLLDWGIEGTLVALSRAGCTLNLRYLQGPVRKWVDDLLRACEGA